MDYPAIDVTDPRWLVIPNKSTEGYITFYLRDDLSSIPVRGVTLPQNNKADPNIETGTYGLFSTCALSMRASIVQNGITDLFFLTKCGGRRVLVGYYQISHYADGPFVTSPPDYCLCASQVHFVNPPIDLKDIPEPTRSEITTRFRIFKRISTDAVTTLKDTLYAYPNALKSYLNEIDRLERFNRYHSGYRYIEWHLEDPFSASVADRFLPPIGVTTAGKGLRSTTSPTGRWVCSTCAFSFENHALLKLCPECHNVGTLQPDL